MTKTPIPAITNYLRFVECCSGTEIFFRGSLPIINGNVYIYSGTLPYAGTGGILQPGSCYTVYAEYTNGQTPYPVPPPFIDLDLVDQDLGCDAETCPACPILIQNCYLISPCNGEEPIISNNIAFEDYIGTFVTVISEPFTGCAYVITLEDTSCEDAVEIYPDPDIPCNCPLQCYYIANSNGFFYVDDTDTLVNVSALDANPYVKVCSKIPPIFQETDTEYIVVNFGPCGPDGCPIVCHKLTNCNTGEIIYTNTDTILQYVYGTDNIVKIVGRDGCWIASVLDRGEICDCPIDVVVTSSYATCELCIGPIAYKLTSCDNNDVIYTILNLEAYIGQVVKLYCGCYIVEQINIIPPNPQTIKPEDIFPDCISCTRTYYELKDCAGVADSIITYSDLSGYVGGVINIQNCPGCWIVSKTTNYLNATTVVVTADFQNCEACGVDIICQCSTVTNYNDVRKVYSYYDCDRNLQVIALNPGETSSRECLTEWVTDDACSCLQANIRYLVDEVFQETNFQFEITDEIVNGYPTYKACINYIDDQEILNICYTIAFYDGCWYALYTEVNPLALGITSWPSYKLCPNLACPIGVWEYFPCGCFTGTFTYCITPEECITTIVTFRATGQINGYFYYTGYYNGELVQITFNALTNRWELTIVTLAQFVAYSNYKGECPVQTQGDDAWISISSDLTFKMNDECDFGLVVPRLSTRPCEEECNCLNILIGLYLSAEYTGYYNLVAVPNGNIVNGKPEYVAYFNGYQVVITYQPIGNVWTLYDVNNDDVVANILYNANYPDCPVGTWTILVDYYVSVDTEYCAQNPIPFDDPLSIIQYFGECLQGVCPQPQFKNNRTIRPGYNTPNCNPDEYDKITCRAADVMYKLVLEKRYGITNCCPDEDDKWLFKKELIDLQSLKDPNYKCPDCPCACNSGKTYSSCNCGN